VSRRDGEELRIKGDEPLGNLSDELESLLDSLVGNLDTRLKSGVVGLSVELEKVEGVVSGDRDEGSVGRPGDLSGIDATKNERSQKSILL